MSDHAKGNVCDSAEWAEKHRHILNAAKHLFLVLGYEGTTMKQVAQSADCSVGYLYKHFTGKKEILNEMLETYLDIYDEIRVRVRQEESQEGIECMRRELQLICEVIADHRSLIPIIYERQSNQSESVRRRLADHQREDIQLLDAARLRGELPDLDPAMLHAVLDGATWALFRDLAQTQRREVFLSIPDTIDRLIFEPLRRSSVAGSGKDFLKT